MKDCVKASSSALFNHFCFCYPDILLGFEVAACDRVLIENSGEDLECKGMDAEAGGP